MHTPPTATSAAATQRAQVRQAWETPGPTFTAYQVINCLENDENTLAGFKAACIQAGGVQMDAGALPAAKGGVRRSTMCAFWFPDGSALVGWIRDGLLRAQQGFVNVPYPRQNCQD